MATEIVFSGEHTVTVVPDIPAIRQDIENTGQGRPMLDYEVFSQRDHAGNPAQIVVNWGQIAYLREPRTEQSRVPFSH